MKKLLILALVLLALAVAVVPVSADPPGPPFPQAPWSNAHAGWTPPAPWAPGSR